MKRILMILLLVSLTACTTRTAFGECVGVNNDRDPTLNYRLSVWNVVLAVVFAETIVVPIVVVAEQYECPVSKK